MKTINLIFFLTLYLIFGGTNGQTTNRAGSQKINNNQNANTTIKTKTNNLIPEDFKYYYLVRRGQINEQSKNYYTLGNNVPTGINTACIIIDIRTMKEVSFWNDKAVTYLSEDGKNLFSLDSKRNLYSFSNLGKLNFFQNLTIPYSETFAGSKLFLSKDFKKVAFSFNSDVWIAELSGLTGKVSNHKQITSFAPRANPGYLYFDNSNLFIGNTPSQVEECYAVNLLTNESKIMPQPIKVTELRDNYISFELVEGNTSHIVLANISKQSQKLTNLDIHHGRAFFMDNDNLKLIHSLPASRKSTAISNIYNVENTNLIGQRTIEWFATEDPYTPKADYTSINNKIAFPRYQQNSSFQVLEPHDLRIHEIPIQFLENNIFENISWIDDIHFLFNAEIGTKINDLEINLQTKGTYIFDINTKIYKKLTPYLLDNRGFFDDDFGRYKLLVASQAESNSVMFQANGYLFSCKLDGTEVKQLTNYPNVYRLIKPFIDDKLPLKGLNIIDSFVD